MIGVVVLFRFMGCTFTVVDFMIGSIEARCPQDVSIDLEILGQYLLSPSLTWRETKGLQGLSGDSRSKQIPPNTINILNNEQRINTSYSFNTPHDRL